MVAAFSPPGAAVARSPEASSAGWTAALTASLRGGGALVNEPSAVPLAPLRSEAILALADRPLPSRREEDWRFTPTDPLTAIAPRLVSSPPDPVAGGLLPGPSPSTFRLVLDGSTDPLEGVTLPPGLAPLSPEELEANLGSILALTGCRDHWPVLLNQACSSRVLGLRVSGPVASILEVVSEAGTAEGILPLRILLVLEERASLELHQVHHACGASLTSVVVEARLDQGARLHHGVLSRGGDEAVLLAHLAVAQAPESHYGLSSLSSHWGLVRLEPRIVQTGGHATSRLRGLQVARDRQVADTHSLVLFAGPEGKLDQVHKAVADDAAHSIFNGAVRVPCEAQRTDASQLSRNLLLSQRARIDTKPELEIVADDVKCAHGATVSRLQQEELFYLQSRGIAADQAARLLLRGFCEEVLRELPTAAAVWQPLADLLSREVAPR